MSDGDYAPIQMESWFRIGDEGEMDSIEYVVMSSMDGYEVIAMTEAAYLLMFMGIDNGEDEHETDKWLMVYASGVRQIMEQKGYQCVISTVADNMNMEDD